MKSDGKFQPPTGRMEACVHECMRPMWDSNVTIYTTGSRTEGEKHFLVITNEHILLLVKKYLNKIYEALTPLLEALLRLSGSQHKSWDFGA